MEFTSIDEKQDFISAQLSGEPRANVISKEDFEDRVDRVFHKLWEDLSKSFGPGGAGTFISIYPNYYNTKDGFTIMKNVGFDKKLDQFICDMAMDICSRLNFTAGDGTTTSVIATKSIYDSYRQMVKASEVDNESDIHFNKILPRDILTKLNILKEKILEKLSAMATSIQSDDPDILANNIRKVVYVSSNANEEITNIISSMYRELMYPAISCVISKDGSMHSSIVSGYKNTVSLTDKLYCNNDNGTCKLATGANVLIFSHKITKDTYDKILKPLTANSRRLGKRLICVAPYYDDVAINGSIARELNAEFKNTGEVGLVLTVCKRPTGPDKVALSDLAMLLNTVVITPEMEAEAITKISSYGEGNEGISVLKIFDLNTRNIPGINIYTTNEEGTELHIEKSEAGGRSPLKCEVDPAQVIRVGYCDSVEIGVENSLFSGFYYDKALYRKYVQEAKDDLADIAHKVKTIGSYSADYNHKQQRVYALGLKTGVIEVGASSEISQNYLKDTVDDAVKAAKSAYENGVVLGCNVTLMRAMNMVKDEIKNDKVMTILLILLINGFRSVYETVLSNVFENRTINVATGASELNSIIKEIRGWRCIENTEDSVDDAIFQNAVKNSVDSVDSQYDLYSSIIDISVDKNVTFDLSTCEFSRSIINSAETDKEILKATIDLLGLLITGNQVVIR